MLKEALAKIAATRYVYCNRCSGDTRHESFWKSHRQDADVDEEGSPTFMESWIYVGWKCLGCDSVSLEERYTCDGMHDESGRVWDSTFHPNRARNKIRAKNFFSLPEPLDRIYKESIAAFNAEAEVLSAVGLGSLIEGVCRDKKIGGRSLQVLIDGLAKILPESVVKNLHSLRFMGNTATHELTPPSQYELRLAIEICEDLLNYLYELDYKTARLGQITVSRHKLNGKSGETVTPF